MEVADGAFDFVARLAVNGAGEAELGVVGDFESVIEAVGFDDGEDRSEDFFLLEFGFGRDVGDHRGADVVTFSSFGGARAAGEDASVSLALLDVFQNRLHGAFVDDRAHVGVFGGSPTVIFSTLAFNCSRNLS